MTEVNSSHECSFTLQFLFLILIWEVMKTLQFWIIHKKVINENCTIIISVLINFFFHHENENDIARL